MFDSFFSVLFLGSFFHPPLNNEGGELAAPSAFWGCWIYCHGFTHHQCVDHSSTVPLVLTCPLYLTLVSQRLLTQLHLMYPAVQVNSLGMILDCFFCIIFSCADFASQYFLVLGFSTHLYYHFLTSILVLLKSIFSISYNFFKDFIYLYLEREEGREKEREKNINVWLLLTWPPLGTWPATQACALTRNWTSNPLWPALSPLSYTSQSYLIIFNDAILIVPCTCLKLSTGLLLVKRHNLSSLTSCKALQSAVCLDSVAGFPWLLSCVWYSSLSLSLASFCFYCCAIFSAWKNNSFLSFGISRPE